jgi:hypothetical protein
MLPANVILSKAKNPIITGPFVPASPGLRVTRWRGFTMCS